MASHGHRARNSRAPVVPAIPLPYLQRRSQNSVTKTPPEPATLRQASIAIDSAVGTTAVTGKLSRPSPPTPTPERVTYTAKENTLPAEQAISNHAVSNNAPDAAAQLHQVDVMRRQSPSKDIPHQGLSLYEPTHPEHQSANSPAYTIRPSHQAAYAPPSGAPFTFPPASERSGPLPGPPGFPANAHHPFHPAHSRDASLVFGGFQNSKSTSPAPHSGGLVPPPGLAGGMPYMAFPPNQGDWGRNLVPYPNAINGFPPLTPGFDPSSPHSFHGSQSSAHTEENGYTRTPATNGQNGWAGPGMDLPQSIDSRPMVPPGLLGVEPGHLESVIAQIQRSYGEGEFADCELYISFLPALSRGQPIPGGAAKADQFPFPFLGHRAILAQSRAFQDLFRRQTPFRNKLVPQYNLKFADPYLTTYSVQMALRFMYGLPLVDIANNTDAGMHSGKPINKGLALITAANFFDLPYISFHGVTQTLRFIDCDNVDRVLAFCLDGATNLHLPSRNDGMNIPCAEATFKYGKGFGEHIRELIRGAVTLVARTFPVNFVLDVTVSDSSYGRLHLASAAAPTTSPAIVHGTSRTFSHGPANGSPEGLRRPGPRGRSMNSRLAQIRFGSMSPPKLEEPAPKESVNAASESTPQSPSPVPTPEESINTAVSRVLLTVPFEILKSILEHPDLPLWMQPELRYRVMCDVMAEREARRLRVVDDVRSERVQNWQAILQRLEGDMLLAPGAGSEGDVLGWREAVVPGPNAAQMVREWTQLKPASTSS